MRNKIFAYSILGLNVVAAWVSWWVLAGAIFGSMRHIWLCPVLAFGIWGIAFTLSAIFVKNRKFLYASFILSGIGYPIFFGASLSALGVALAVLIFIFTESQAKKEIARGITINFYQLVSHTLKYFVTAACIVIAVAYYFSITDKAAAPTPTFIEAKTLETEMNWGLKAAGFVLSDEKRGMLDDIANNETVDEFLSKNFVDPGIDENMETVNNIMPGSPTDTTKIIGDAAAEKIKEEMLAKSKKDLAKQLGVDVVGEQPMKNVLMAYIDKTERGFFEYSGTDKFYIPIILAAGIFLTARILGTAVDIFLGLFILGIIKLLRMSGIIQVNREQKEAAVIEYSI
ncbi:MAG: hypothetical protein Q8L09_02070 [Candidatus Moranbacteria bacterium]|nr:hypothetical protein [Candidatus Moranbacteria bacterium]